MTDIIADSLILLDDFSSETKEKEELLRAYQKVINRTDKEILKKVVELNSFFKTKDISLKVPVMLSPHHDLDVLMCGHKGFLYGAVAIFKSWIRDITYQMDKGVGEGVLQMKFDELTVSGSAAFRVIDPKNERHTHRCVFVKLSVLREILRLVGDNAWEGELHD
jgi:hypothetical protein